MIVEVYEYKEEISDVVTRLMPQCEYIECKNGKVYACFGSVEVVHYEQ